MNEDAMPSKRMVPAQQLSDAGEDLVRLAAAKDAEIAALQRTFDLQWEADQRAIKRWQEAHPGSELIWPDRADMVVWLMEQLDAATATFDDEQAAHQDTLRLWQRAKAEINRTLRNSLSPSKPPKNRM